MRCICDADNGEWCETRVSQHTLSALTKYVHTPAARRYLFPSPSPIERNFKLHNYGRQLSFSKGSQGFNGKEATQPKSYSVSKEESFGMVFLDDYYLNLCF